MRINPQLLEKIRESLASVLPITTIVLLLSITIVPLTTGALVLFLFGSVQLIVGVGLFTLEDRGTVLLSSDHFGMQGDGRQDKRTVPLSPLLTESSE